MDDSNPFARISAMPSMHVAMVTLYVLAARQANRWLGWGVAIYGTLILVGSVHLGWHYAIDGYVSIALAFVIWVLSGRVVRLYGGPRL